ncbi:DNA-binding protein [Candidatus Magnetomorum sp. HK-1]|nr:DNA-binding protein [Candidatus Magnetomorum sp. HK-1]
MNKWQSYETERTFLGRMPKDQDILNTIEKICQDESIQMATFSLIGAVSKLTYGYYDQKLRQYISFTQEGSFEILQCTGNVSQYNGSPFVHAHIMVADHLGRTTGGHLFSDTLIFAGEIELNVLKGNIQKREKDLDTGLNLWMKTTNNPINHN